MASSREGLRLARALGRVRLQPSAIPSCARTFAAEAVPKPQQQSSPSVEKALADLDSSPASAVPVPEKALLESFDPLARYKTREQQLPGNRYQYHPPKYYRGPLHPVQMPPSSDPTARDFVPGPFNIPRGKHTYDTTIAPDLMTLTYTHVPPGTPPSESQKGHLRQWDGSSPYHKNRPARGPRGGGSSRLGLLERGITHDNIPEVTGVSIAAFAPLASENKEYLQVARAVVQAITGTFPESIRAKKNVVQWKLREGQFAGAKAELEGPAAYEFLDKLITLVLPKIKDWPGMKSTSGDGAGNLALGMRPEWMAFFPELEFNYDMYPPKLVPGCHINIKTSATSDRHGRLLMEAMGMPFYVPAKKK